MYYAESFDGFSGIALSDDNVFPSASQTTEWEWEYPEDFDWDFDRDIEAITVDIGDEIAQAANNEYHEYFAIIWKDATDGLHRTHLEEGTTIGVPVTNLWGDIDFAGGGKIVAYVHSHPFNYNRGSVENPIWAENNFAKYPSSGDMDKLWDYADGGNSGYDADHFRTYLWHNGEMKEYYAFMQDPANMGSSGPATWALPSNDYLQSS